MKESNLADHGVRKYENEVVVFTSIDPLWEQYRGWSPYQYAGNNPIMGLDWNGKKFDYISKNSPENASLMEKYVNMSIDYLIKNGAKDEAKILTDLRDDPDNLVFIKFDNNHNPRAEDNGKNKFHNKTLYKSIATLHWDPFSAITTLDGLSQSPALGL